MPSSLQVFNARARPRQRLIARRPVTVRRFGSCGQSEHLLDQLGAWALSVGLPPVADATVGLRLGLELVAIEASRAGDEVDRRALRKRIERSASGEWRNQPATKHEDQKAGFLPPVPLPATERASLNWQAFHEQTEALAAQVMRERRRGKSNQRKETP